jgi:hypothetical protein
MVRFIRQHPLLRPTTATTLLPAYFFDSCPLGRDIAFPRSLDLVQKQAPGNKSVKGLLPSGLAFDLKPCRPVKEHYAGGCLINILPAMPTRAHKGFLQVGFRDAKISHA